MPFTNWNNLAHSERVNLVASHLSTDAVCETLGFLAEEYPDFGAQCQAARLLSATGKAGPLPAPNKPVRTIAAYYYHIEGGGIETALQSLARNLGERYRSIVITEAGSSAWAGGSGDRQSLAKTDIVSLGDIEGESHFEKLKAVLEHQDVDVLVYHAWFDANLLWDIALCHACGVRVILNVHGVFSHFLEVSDGQHYPWSDGRLFVSVAQAARLCDAIVSQSDVNRQFYAHFNPRSYAIAHELPTLYQLYVDMPRSFDNTTAKLLWVGRFDPYKHPEDALDVLARVRKTLPDATLTFVGQSADGVYEAELASRIEQLHLGGAVTFAGFHADVSPFYREADVVISTTEVEGFCMVLAEACACGTPVVAYDLPYLPFAQCEGIHWAPQGDAATAARHACTLLADERLWERASRSAQEFMKRTLYENLPSTWQDVITGLESSPDAKALSAIESERTMWDTLLDHYVIGEQRAHDLLVRRGAEAEAAHAEAGAAIAERDEIESSRSFKVGKALLAIPRAAKDKLSRS